MKVDFLKEGFLFLEKEESDVGLFFCKSYVEDGLESKLKVYG